MDGITTAEQKAALVTAGWKPRDAGTYEAWEKGDFVVALYADGLRNIGHRRQKDVPLAVALEVAAILGMAATGYAVVSVENIYEANVVLNEAIGEKQLLDTALSREFDTSDADRTQRQGEHKEWAADLRKRFTALLS